MQHNWFIKSINILMVFLLSYSLIFLALHFFTPNIGHVNIDIDISYNSSDAKIISLNILSPPEKYYFIIYEADEEENWLYSTSPAFTSVVQYSIVDKFLPSSQQNFLFLEGTKQRNEITFKLISKYTPNITATKQYVFHAYYIVPFNFFPFPSFYYSKHYTFFIDPTI